MLELHADDEYCEDWYDASIWYPDGDRCAYVRDNLALGVRAKNIAALFAAAPKLLNELLNALESVEWIEEGDPMDEILSCPWCGSLMREGHRSGCERQEAIAAAKRILDDN